MFSFNRRSPVNADPQLSQSLERAIQQLSKDDSVRKASAGQIARRKALLVDKTEDTEAADVLLERIMAGNDLIDINYLAVGLQVARAVGRVVIREQGRTLGYGTGFMVAPGVMITNWHVLKSAARVRDSVIQFRYERDARGGELIPAEFDLRIDPTPIIDQGLDFALARVEPRSQAGEPLEAFGWLRLNPSPGKAFVGEYLTIIQHPGGERKQICVRENKLIRFQDGSPYLWYQTDTVGGSSGSPAFNSTWDVVALHHSSVPKTKSVNGKDVWIAKSGQPWLPEMGDDAIDWIANEGVRISRIVDSLARRHPNETLSREVRETAESPLRESLAASADCASTESVRIVTDRQGNTRVFVPLEIDIKMEVGGRPLKAVLPASVAAVPSKVGDRSTPNVIEAVEIDQTNYDQRNGYDPKFLGDGLVVPLPKVKANTFGQPLKLAGNKTELKYWNYSVVMNAARGLAYFSAANIRPKNPNSTGDGNNFIRDPRVDEVDEDAQLGSAFYKKQATFEAEDRTKNPFDQGHLTRREDLQWGKTVKLAKRNGDDSFHYTNCAPQHFEFNQNRAASGIWYRLEKSAVDSLSSGDNLCLINGPVFNAPLCKPGTDGVLRLNLDGPRKADPTFGGVRIPRMYFKLIAYNEEGALRAKAFVVTQEDLLENLDRLQQDEAAALTDAEIRLYQVKIPALQKLTGLNFQLPAKALVPLAEEGAMLDEGNPIVDESAVQFP